MSLAHTSSRPGRGRSGLLLFLVVGFLVAGLIVVGAITQRPASPGPSEPPPDEKPRIDDPRQTFATPFLNVRPEVHYVGDAACLDCHREICDKFHAHPMGRSMALGGADSSKTGTFDAANLHYESTVRDGRLIHSESATRPDKTLLAEKAVTIQYVIGSGGRGHSYLFADDGYLSQSPISWYSGRHVLDLSPGYRDRNSHFDRPVDANCLFCHANCVEPVEGSVNRYREPIFSSPAIGCERCHGPGELHVKQPGAAHQADYTIVNPKRLEPALREAVCQQCHLQGQARVLREGRESFDFRPGLPLELFYDTFVWHLGVPHGQKAVGHVEQMTESACFTRSAGKLGCASCHDPHEKPPPDKQAMHYRQRCLSCHNERQCSVPLADRRAKNQDACAACHMPPSSTVDVVHVSITDHRILRNPKQERHRDVPPPHAGEPPLVSFHAGSKYIPREDRERDLALALMHLAGQTQPGPQRDYLARLSAGRLVDRQGLTADPPAVLALAAALRATGRRAEALTTLEGLLERQPQYEQALVDAGTSAGELNRPSEAAAFWRRAIELSPRRWHYHFQLASALADQRDWAAALAECEIARRLNPMQTEVRLLEVGCLIDVGRKDDAKRAFDDLMILKPPRAEELRKWFDQQLKK